MSKNLVLENLNISEFLEEVFKEENLQYSVLGDKELLRNIVVLVEKYNIILKVYGNDSRWQREISKLSLFQNETYVPSSILLESINNMAG